MPTTTDRFPKLKKLVNSKEGSTRIFTRTLDDSVNELAERFKRRKVKGSLFLDLHDDETAKYLLRMGEGEADVKKEAGEADLTLITDKATWVEMATGRLSPGDAFLNGKMEVHGDISLARRLYALTAKVEADAIYFFDLVSTTGTVNYIGVGEYFNCFELNTAAGSSLMRLWDYQSSAPTAAQRIVHNQYLTLLRDALANGNTVEITHARGSLLPIVVQIHQTG